MFDVCHLGLALKHQCVVIVLVVVVGNGGYVCATLCHSLVKALKSFRHTEHRNGHILVSSLERQRARCEFFCVCWLLSTKPCTVARSALSSVT